MKRFFNGIAYNLKGLMVGLKSPGLLILGLTRLVVLIIITIAAGVIILDKYQEILNLMWNRPESAWILWLWHLVSWLVALLLIGISAVVGFLVSQIIFSAIIMDYMSQITERRATGEVKTPEKMPFLKYYLYLLKQEIPRAVIPILITLLILVLGWFTPLGPILTIISPLVAAIFLAWDNTDLVPARRMMPFSERFRSLRKQIIFHFGFGILFLIPLANILLLSFAPVGATLYWVEQMDQVAHDPEKK